MRVLRGKLLELAGLHEELLGGSVPKSLIEEVTKGASYNIVVMGGISKGKSTFVNALLGIKELIPTGGLSGGTSVFKVVYGEEISFTVHFLPVIGKNVEALSPRCISREELPLYMRSAEDEPASLQIDYIEVSCPSKLLQSGVTIVDTPGIGGAEYVDIWRFVEQADAVFYLIDHSAPVDRTDCNCLKKVLGITDNIFVVQSKYFALSQDASFDRWNNNKSIISSIWPDFDESRFFMLDAECVFAPDADEEDLLLSGYPGVRRDCLQPLIRQMNQAVCSLHIENWRFVFENCYQALRKRIARYRSQNGSDTCDVAEAAQRMEKIREMMKDEQSRGALRGELGQLYAKAIKASSAVSPEGDLYKSYAAEIDCCNDYNEFLELLRGTDENDEQLIEVRLEQDLKRMYSDIVQAYAKDVANAQLIVLRKGMMEPSQCGALNSRQISMIIQERKQRCKLVAALCAGIPLLHAVITIACYPVLSLPVFLAGGMVPLRLYRSWIERRKTQTPEGLQMAKNEMKRKLELVFAMTHSKLCQSISTVDEDVNKLLSLAVASSGSSGQKELPLRDLNQEKEILQSYMARINHILPYFNH